ncbi:MAG: hypothetical protein NC200_06365 [Candidatus Gastranaerophilales bacterium]|nr:hypothetical protein [Candidatus Gastranaerophilales bacterium]
MKKFFIAIVSIICFASSVFAHSITFNKEVYELQYSRHNETSYINEYVRPTQNLDNWTNIITVHYFTNEKIDEYIKKFLYVIGKLDSAQVIKYSPENNLFSFMVGRKLTKQKGYFEYNVLRVEKAKEGGIMVLQLGHKYKFKDTETLQKAMENCVKYNTKYTNLILKTPMPKIVKETVEVKCK